MANPNYTFKKRILVPFWVIRGLLVLLFIIAFGYMINMTSCQYDDAESMIIFYIFLIGVLLLDILQIFYFYKNKLTPLTFLTLNAMQCGFWVGNFFADIASMSRTGADPVTIGIILFILVLYLPMLVYASIGYHRQRKQQRLGNYSLTYNPAQQEARHNLPVYQGQAPTKPANMV
ncbi:hypothetical protein DM02DRAFT_519444 [Periconia macrospinosa]|uniref:Uncharacterized protein n=1 Tax=Periconia macrospinosa TaxID=97972 RepID=A0A2V1E1B8_9PLEO|nr:hypothetical protein DM02DRAFT_519444 [Periconia macrospinosa]